jgi:hypothetical protein
MATDWYFRVNNEERGPVSSETLKHLALEGRVTPETPIKKGASGHWTHASQVKGLFTPVVGQSTPPPLPVPSAVPVPEPVKSAPQHCDVLPSVVGKPVPSRHPPIDTYHGVLLGVGAACMVILAISPCLTWVTIMGGGMLGIEGDGKIVLILTLVLGVGLGIDLLIYRWASVSVLLAQAWGTIASLWMVGEIWRVFAIRQSPETHDNMFGQMFALQISPGVGLFVGLFGGLGLAIAFALLTIQRLKKHYAFAITQALSLLVGLGIAAVLGHQSTPSSKTTPNTAPAPELAQRLFGTTRATSPPIESPSVRLGETITLDQLKVTPTKVELKKVKSRHDERETKEPVLSLTIEVENISDGQVFTPYASATGKDSFGNDLEEVGGQFGSFSPEGSAELDDLKPKQKAIVVVCLVPKLDTAASYQWKLLQECNNKKDDYRNWTLKFDASEISRPSLSKTRATEVTTPPPSASHSEEQWNDASKPVQQGKVQIEVTQAFVGKVPLKSLGDEGGESKDPLCQISLRITNRASASKIDYRGWQGNSLLSHARLTDEVGNRYRGISFGFGTKVVGQVESESIYPGKSIEDKLVFEVPVDSAKYLRLELPASNLGEKGTVRFQIARHFSSTAAEKPNE